MGDTSAASKENILPEVNEEGGGLFVILPMEVLRDPTITPAAKLVYARLGFYAGRDGRCNPSHETLAAEVCLSSRQVRRVLDELKARGWLTWKRTRSSCWFTVSGPLPDRTRTSTLESEIGHARPIRSDIDVLSRVDAYVLQKDVLLKQDLKDHPQERAVVPSMEIPKSESPWKEFVALYPPHRMDTEQAERAFRSRDDAIAINSGLKLAVTSEQWTKEGGRFVPRASRWISDGAYRDAARLAQPAKTVPSQYFDTTKITGPVRVPPTPEEAEKQQAWYAKLDAQFALGRTVRTAAKAEGKVAV